MSEELREQYRKENGLKQGGDFKLFDYTQWLEKRLQSQSIPDEQTAELEDINLEEAIKVIRDYSDSGKYIAENIKQFMTGGGEPDDDSIQLDEHYFNCLNKVLTALQSKQKVKPD